MKTIQERFADLMSHLNAEDAEAFAIANEIKDDLDAIAEAVQRNYDPDFDYGQEHWNNGNYDDSFDYGRECGLQDLAAELEGYFVEEPVNEL